MPNRKWLIEQIKPQKVIPNSIANTVFCISTSRVIVLIMSLTISSYFSHGRNNLVCKAMVPQIIFEMVKHNLLKSGEST